MRRVLHAVTIVILVCTAPACGQPSTRGSAAGQPSTQTQPDLWRNWRFLLGDWVGEGDGKLGESVGPFSFQFDLQGKVLARRSHAEHPATKDHPAFRHEDLMIVYPGTDSAHAKAVSFDSEGHVIHYNAEVAADQRTFTFLSDAAQPGPRFRLIYNRLSPHSMEVKFEVAPPDKPNAFTVYLTGTVVRSE